MNEDIFSDDIILVTNGKAPVAGSVGNQERKERPLNVRLREILVGDRKEEIKSIFDAAVTLSEYMISLGDQE